MNKRFTFVLASLLAFVSMSAFAQTHHELAKMDKDVELLLDTAAKHMVNFVLTQKESEYNLAVEKVNKAEELNNTLIDKGAKFDAAVLEDRKEEIASYKDASIKTTILNEKASDRKLKVKFKGQTYSVSDKSKKLFDQFSADLPKN